MKKSDVSHVGILGWSVSLVAFILAFLQPFVGLILGVVAFVMNNKSQKQNETEWTNTGIKLSIYSIIISIVIFLLTLVAIKFLGQYLPGLGLN